MTARGRGPKAARPRRRRRGRRRRPRAPPRRRASRPELCRRRRPRAPRCSTARRRQRPGHGRDARADKKLDQREAASRSGAPSLDRPSRSSSRTGRRPRLDGCARERRPREAPPGAPSPATLSVSDSAGAGGAVAVAASQPPTASGPSSGPFGPARKRATHLTCTSSSVSSVTKSRPAPPPARRPPRSGPRGVLRRVRVREDGRDQVARMGVTARVEPADTSSAQNGSKRRRSATWRTARSASMLLSSRAPARDTLTTQNVTAVTVRSRSPPATTTSSSEKPVLAASCRPGAERSGASHAPRQLDGHRARRRRTLHAEVAGARTRRPRQARPPAVAELDDAVRIRARDTRPETPAHEGRPGRRSPDTQPLPSTSTRTEADRLCASACAARRTSASLRAPSALETTEPTCAALGTATAAKMATTAITVTSSNSVDPLWRCTAPPPALLPAPCGPARQQQATTRPHRARG